MKVNPMNKIVKSLTGKEPVLRENLSVLYTGELLERAVKDYRKQLFKRYLAVAAATIFLASAAAVSSFLTDPNLTGIARPGAGQGSRTIPITVQGSYEGHVVESPESLHVSAVVLSKKQIRKRLKSFAKKLPEQVAPVTQNGVRLVTENLELPERDEKTGIELRWESSDPEVLSQKGVLDLFSMKDQDETVTLSAVLSLDHVTMETSFDVFVSNIPEAYDASLRSEMAAVLEQLSEQNEGDRLVLPGKTESGIQWKWMRREEPYALLICFAGFLFLFCLYAGRYDRARKQARKYREEVIAEFPSVVDKLVLLLNSGLTVFSALMRISSDYADERQYRNSPMAVEISAIGQKVMDTNSPVIEEWKHFATRMESSEILRFCTILEDNMSKGSELSMKLENESDELRDLRKKNIQQYIREIDSRMMIPMLMMLFSLVLVTIAPVLTGF